MASNQEGPECRLRLYGGAGCGFLSTYKLERNASNRQAHLSTAGKMVVGFPIRILVDDFPLSQSTSPSVLKRLTPTAVAEPKSHASRRVVVPST